MSTNITAIYNRLITDIETALSTYVRIPNPYAPEENPELFLRKGYGIGIGPAENTRRYICGFYSLKRSFSVLLINKIEATDSNSSARGSIEITMIEDHKSLMDALESDNNLNGNAVSVMFTNDSGIQFVQGDIGKYVLCELTFEVEYLEPIS